MTRPTLGRLDLIGLACALAAAPLFLLGRALLRAADRDVCKTAGAE